MSLKSAPPCRLAPGSVRFGVYLPNITAAKGYQVVVRIIHELDQFTPEIPPRDFDMQFEARGTPLGLWSTTVNVTAGIGSSGHFGSPGRYLYRYRLLKQLPGQAQPTIVTSIFTDPFATEAGPAKLAAFRIDDPANPTPVFSFDDDAFTVPGARRSGRLRAAGRGVLRRLRWRDRPPRLPGRPRRERA